MNAPSYLDLGLQPLDDLLTDPATIEIALNPDGSVWVERTGDPYMRREDRRLVPGSARRIGEKVAGDAKSNMGKENPIVSASTVYKGRPLRVETIIPPITTGEAALSFRLFSAQPLADFKIQYLQGREVSVADERNKRSSALKALAKNPNPTEALLFCVQQRLNMVLCGGTSTGKTVLLRKLLEMIDPRERLITIEDSYELYARQENVVALKADREKDARSPDKLLLSTLRMRPDRLIVGEVRGKETMTFLEAINTGHGGSITSFHAETPELAIDRMAIAAGRADVPMSYENLKEYIRKSLDVIIQLGRSEERRGIAEFYIPDYEERPC